MQKTRRTQRIRRQLHIRKSVTGTAARPRLAVFRSHKHIYAQIIDDTLGKTLASASDHGVTSGPAMEKASAVGKALAAAAKKAKVTQVVFDRAGYRYHGRVKALADSAREGGLQF